MVSKNIHIKKLYVYFFFLLGLHPGMSMPPQGSPMQPMGYQSHQMQPNVCTLSKLRVLIAN